MNFCANKIWYGTDYTYARTKIRTSGQMSVDVDSLVAPRLAANPRSENAQAKKNQHLNRAQDVLANFQKEADNSYAADSQSARY